MGDNQNDPLNTGEKAKEIAERIKVINLYPNQKIV